MAHHRGVGRHAVYSILLGVVLCGSTQAADSDYFPIEEGIIWRYDAGDDIQGWQESRYFFGTIELNGTTAHILHYEGGPYDGMREYWSKDAEGDIRYHGFSQPPLISLIVFTPPILWYDFPLYVGKTWQTSPSQIDLLFEVVQQRSITVPAGTFQSFTIERYEAPEKTSVVATDGLARRSRARGHEGWEDVAPAVGLVRSVTSWEQFHLRAIDTVTAVKRRLGPRFDAYFGSGPTDGTRRSIQSEPRSSSIEWRERRRQPAFTHWTSVVFEIGFDRFAVETIPAIAGSPEPT